MRRTRLPGVGIQYDVTTRDGRHLSLVAHQDGRRFLGFYAEDDPDSCRSTIALEAEEATTLAGVLAPGEGVSEQLRPGEMELVTERIPVGQNSRYRGRPLGDTKARTRTGASIVAVLRRTGPIPSPGPDFRLEAGDWLVAVGTREGVDDLTAIVAEG